MKKGTLKRKNKRTGPVRASRYFRIAGMTVRVDSDLPMDGRTFHPKFRHFEVSGPGKDTIRIRHRFFLPGGSRMDWGKELYRKPPWVIYKKNRSWVYLGILPPGEGKGLNRVAIFNHDHTRGEIYNDGKKVFLEGGLHSLTLFPSDQILLARLLADRQGCYLHSCGVNLGGRGLLFVGHSGAGKSTMATLLKNKAAILCDDRMIVRRHGEGFRIHGTWSHGDVPEVSGGAAPLQAILFLEKADHNRIVPLKDPKEAVRRLLACLIKPFVTAHWWEKSLALMDRISREVPCYVLEFEKRGKVVDLLDRVLSPSKIHENKKRP